MATPIGTWLPRVVFESLLIVVSILLALALDEWTEDLEIEELVTRSVASFERELQQNKARIEDAIPYHAGILGVLRRLDESGEDKTLAQYREVISALQPTRLLRSAWDTAVATGALSRMDYEMVAALSQTYDAQARFNELYALLGMSYLPGAAHPGETLDLSIYRAVRLMTELTAAEAELQAMYEVGLDLIAEYRDAGKGGVADLAAVD